MTPFIIADIGSNHRGSLEKALRAVEVAKQCGADAVKFQLFRFEDLYGIPGTLPFTLPADWLPDLAAAAKGNNLEFMCTPFSPRGVGEVDPFVQRHKIASSEFCHREIIDAMTATGKPIIASTGGQSHGDLKTFYHYVYGKIEPDLLTILECVALYPAPANLYDLETMNAHVAFTGPDEKPSLTIFPGHFGLSDHTLTDTVAVAAVGAGATVFEKHLDPFPGEGETPDSCVSVLPGEFRMYCGAIREAASAMGDGIKQPKHQHDMQLKWRRRLIATRTVEPGDTLQNGVNFGIYRSLKPDTKGLPPWALDAVNGKRAIVKLEPGDSVGPRDVE